MATKTKTPAATAVPQTREEVQGWIHQLGTAQRSRITHETAMNEKIAAATAEFAQFIDAEKTIEAQMLAGIATWCEANKAELTKEGKTVKFITGEVSWRANPPSVKFKKGIKLEAIIAHINQLKLAKLFVRIQLEVDKEAILKADDKTKAKLAAAGTITILSGVETSSVTPFEAEVAA